MAPSLWVCAIFLVFVCADTRSAIIADSEGTVNEKCRQNLTKFDPYLAQYIGKR